MIVRNLGTFLKWNITTSYPLEQIFELGQLQIFDNIPEPVHDLLLTFEKFLLRYSGKGRLDWGAEKDLARPRFLSRFYTGHRTGRKSFLLAEPSDMHRLTAFGLRCELVEITAVTESRRDGLVPGLAS